MDDSYVIAAPLERDITEAALTLVPPDAKFTYHVPDTDLPIADKLVSISIVTSVPLIM